MCNKRLLLEAQTRLPLYSHLLRDLAIPIPLRSEIAHSFAGAAIDDSIASKFLVPADAEIKTKEWLLSVAMAVVGEVLISVCRALAQEFAKNNHMSSVRI
ncbi:hypothetical protein KP509_13G046800 [Ceratopteris richardii]|uniref:Uncharacterized protein n=1 Tax=Ceratopteris richardii TaxID=49495 RepID=A0A8T2TIH4_CERRI|nr:hypothetical protein KP509_13G046800 [Ceratopteris richardii]